MLLSFIALHLLMSSTTALTLDDAKRCNSDIKPIDFLVLDGDANAEAIEDEVREDLEKLGLTIETRFLDKNAFNAARAKGEFGLSFSETWGTPYDPHSYVSAWEAEDNANHNALVNLTETSSRDRLLDLIEDVLEEENESSRQSKWRDVHNYYHEQAVMLPLWGRRVVAILNTRLSGYEPGHQQFDFPVHRLRPVSGSTTVTISPGALTGRFETVGNLDPHTYNPNEFFANNWVYEGLVRYGEGGEIISALAKSWTVVDTPQGGSKYTFQLRENVSFHDGAQWDCAAAKMNFDHVLAGALKEPVWHGWYGVPKYLSSWECTNDMELVLTTFAKFYPFLQELTFIRPLRFLSPNAFSEGNSSDPFTANSCEPGWGTLQGEDGTEVVCTGISSISGTGPFAFQSRDTKSLTTADFREIRVDEQVTFQRNEQYWDGVPAIETLKVVRYENSEQIKAALLDDTLDVMWGDGVLPASDILELRNLNNDNLDVFIGDDIQNVVLLLNTGTPPLDDIRIRKTVIHAIDKKRLIEKELGGLLDPVDNVFPRDMPYCNVDLTPHWDYDLEKAMLLSCPTSTTMNVTTSIITTSNNKLAVGLGIGLGLLFVLALGTAMVYFKKSKDLEAKYVTSDKAVSA